MIDFTLKSYGFYLGLIKKQYNHIITFDAFFSCPFSFKRFCILRHDVDRKPLDALKMAALENSHGISSTYFFRAKKHVMDKKIISKIYDLGHEIGYHYESLSDKKGDFNSALKDFELNLKRIRDIVPVTTISMHGRPLSPFDNRDLWRDVKNHKLLKDKHGIKGEVYLDIDYTDIAYISDTGRNWCSTASNVRDHVDSNIQPGLMNQKELIAYLNNPHPKMIFLVHPERWHDDFYGYSIQFVLDTVINGIKYFI